MTFATLAVSATLTENETDRIGDWTDGAPGVVEVERSDDNEVSVHFRHVDSESASISGSMDRAGAVALAQALLAAAEADG